MREARLGAYILYPGVAMEIVFTSMTFGGLWREVERAEGQTSRLFGTFSNTWEL